MHKYKGCHMFIKSRSMKEIASDSWQSTVKRLSSYMNVEDYIDARDTLGSYQFKIEQELVSINNKSLYSSIDKFCSFNSKEVAGNKARRHEQRDKQIAKFKRVVYRF
jgi:hypothetical protein